MKKTYFIIVGIIATFAAGYYLNTFFAQKLINDNKEITKTEN